MHIYDWDKAKENEYKLPYVDDIAFRQMCRIWGGGSVACGRWILNRLTAHIIYADKAHPWDKKQTTTDAFNIAMAEMDEVIGEYEEAVYAGIKTPDALFVDDAELTDHLLHMDYEIGDTIAVFIKMFRMAYGDFFRDEWD